mmetsp:Transcript_35994/g.64347  ORF Transcript_35994/g.64347 Transcript_35994/m.64347 type:complete len:238 (-) Transcript_35994:20-733(-)
MTRVAVLAKVFCLESSTIITAYELLMLLLLYCAAGKRVKNSSTRSCISTNATASRSNRNRKLYHRTLLMCPSRVLGKAKPVAPTASPLKSTGVDTGVELRSSLGPTAPSPPSDVAPPPMSAFSFPLKALPITRVNELIRRLLANSSSRASSRRASRNNVCRDISLAIPITSSRLAPPSPAVPLPPSPSSPPPSPEATSAVGVVRPLTSVSNRCSFSFSLRTVGCGAAPNRPRSSAWR